MPGIVVDDICPKCKKETNVIQWEDEFRGEKGHLTFHYSECKCCGYKWIIPGDVIINFLETFRVLGMKGVPEFR